MCSLKKKKTGKLPEISERLSHGNGRNLRVASEARTRRKTEERVSYLLDIWTNVLMVGQSDGEWSNPCHPVPGVSSDKGGTQWKQV